jgi:diguanylate cyclase (GGDEF)-like protein/PAS domain S-box-containing protein
MNLLIVDDNPTNLKLLHAQLEAEGHAALDAADGVEALRVLERKPVDAVISDILMPNMDGYKLCLEIRKSDRFKSLPFIFYTSTYNSPQDRQLAQSVGADHYINKPAPVPVILEAVNEASRKVRSPTARKTTEQDETQVLEQYSAALVRKLEGKNIELGQSEERFRQMAEQIRDAFFLIELKTGSVLYVSPAYEEIWGRTCESLYADARSWVEAIHPDDRDRVSRMYGEQQASGRFDSEYRIVRPDGAVRWVHARTFPILDQSGNPYRSAGVAEDTTEHKEAEDKIRRLNRVYAVLSRINALIVRVRDRKELFNQACRIAVEDGNFGMAWIGEFDRITLEVTPVAWTGMDENTTFKKASARPDIPEGQGMVGRAIREKKPVVTNDISVDPGAGGQRRAEALRKGFHSIIAMPLTVEGEVAAVLTLFANERNFFSEDEMKLLTELAGDISFALDHLAKAEQLAYVAYYDTLTGLPNRALFLERLSQALLVAAQSSGRLVVTIGDVRRFRMVNETLGRRAGDELLKQIAARLPNDMRNPENLARIAADCFATFLPDIREISEVAHRIENLHASALRQPFQVEGQGLMVSLVVGAAVYPGDGSDAETLLRNAEAAVKKAKSSGEPFLFYEPAINARVSDSLRLENKLHRALEAEQFVLHYQPKIDSRSGAITGVEALIRWQDPETGLVPPGQFIPLLEETGMILAVGIWAIRKALSDHCRWRAAGLRAPRVAVNVSTIQLQQKDFVDVVKSAIGENRASDGAPGGGLDLEITESLIMRNIGETILKLKALRESGVDIMVDDFGTGHSSLGYLARLPITALKIDRSFVDTMSKNPESMTIVSTIISLAHSLNLKVVAEGVETEEQAKMLRLFRCDQLQGFLFSKPVDFDAISVLLGKSQGVTT